MIYGYVGKMILTDTIRGTTVSLRYFLLLYFLQTEKKEKILPDTIRGTPVTVLLSSYRHLFPHIFIVAFFHVA